MSAEDYHSDFYDDPELDDQFDDQPIADSNEESFPMLKKTTKKSKVAPVVDARPKLIHCGNHLIDPNDVVCITKTSKKDLYIVKLRSNPNPEYPIWANERDITSLVKHFNIITE